MNRPASPWLPQHRPQPRARLTLFCLPFAGGGASGYMKWSHELPGDIEVSPVQLPGREDRCRERPINRMGELVDSIVDALLPSMTSRPFAFFGHSLGAIVALETTRALASRRLPAPRHVIVSARPAPHVPLRRRPVVTLTRDELREWLRQQNGTPQAILESPEMMDLVLPALRADLEIDDSYRSSADPPLECPLTAIGGLEDDQALPHEVEQWASYTTSEFTLRFVPGNHFFPFNESRRAALTVVVDALARAV